MKQLTRREFLNGSAAGAASVALLSSMNRLGVKAEEDVSSITWDEETDVVVVGFGASGSIAALTCIQEGASVIVLEKSEVADGGNLGCSTGQIQSSLLPNDTEEELEKWKHFNYGGVSDEEADLLYSTLQEEEMAMPDWLMNELGLELLSMERDYNDPSRAVGTNYWSARNNGTGEDLWGNILEIADEWGLDYRLGTPARRLIQNPETKEVIGVVAENADGEIYIKANKGVIMALGGFENDAMLQNWYTEWGVRLWPWGTPNNTGDGIGMCQAVGASFWHMSAVEWGNLCYRLPSEAVNCSVTIVNDNFMPFEEFGFLLVNKDGKRYINEMEFFSHEPKYGVHHQTYTSFDLDTYEFKNMPFWLIFDQSVFDAGPIYCGSAKPAIKTTYCGVQGLLDDWDNQEAVENGWIFKGDTIEELAANIKGTTPSGTEIEGIDAEALAETVAAFNSCVEAGEDDAEFGRTADVMGALNGPFYAIEMALTTINTQGGPKHNEHHQTLDASNEVIPRLYNVGEFGSMNAGCYNIGNIAEALTTGHFAALHAISLDPQE